MYLSVESSQDTEETGVTRRLTGRYTTSQQKHSKLHSVAVFEGGEETGENSAATEQILQSLFPK